MEQKNTNSKRYKDEQKKKEEQVNAKQDTSTEKSQKLEEENLEDFYTSEEHENFDSQKEDMK